MPTFLVVFLAMLIAPPLLLWGAHQITLDRDRTHTKETAALPFLEEEGRTASRVDGGSLVRIPARGMEFRARVAGLDGDGPALVLLHGFPETSIMWQPLLRRAAEAGFRVVAFDQRGYSPGARPGAISDYAVPVLVDDVMAVADAVGFDRFHLVGHDWGSIVGWAATGTRPDRVLSWASLSIPHPGAIPEPDVAPSVPTYIKVFRVPGLAETLLGAAGRRMLHRVAWQTMTDEHHDEYDAVFSEPGALTAALNWYRALAPEGPPGGDLPPVSQPVLYVYGKRDIAAFVNERVQARLRDYVEGPFEHVALDAGHWLIQDEEAVIVDAVMAHLARVR
ncbi:MAG: alpha/beta fold hydrolase [bacterium]|nr:alpha/beta fold hydrolase [bacterium]